MRGRRGCNGSEWGIGVDQNVIWCGLKEAAARAKPAWEGLYIVWSPTVLPPCINRHHIKEIVRSPPMWTSVLAAWKWHRASLTCTKGSDLPDLHYFRTLILTCGVFPKVGSNEACLGIVMEWAGQCCLGSVKKIHCGRRGGSPHHPHLCCLSTVSMATMYQFVSVRRQHYDIKNMTLIGMTAVFDALEITVDCSVAAFC